MAKVKSATPKKFPICPMVMAAPRRPVKIPVYMGCRTNRYGPFWMSSWSFFKVTVPLQLPPRVRRAQKQKAMPQTQTPTPRKPENKELESTGKPRKAHELKGMKAAIKE